MERVYTAKLPRNIVSCLVTIFNFHSAAFCALFNEAFYLLLLATLWPLLSDVSFVLFVSPPFFSASR